jgi:diguanylate cyclase (GGDEF)-like protein
MNSLEKAQSTTYIPRWLLHIEPLRTAAAQLVQGAQNSELSLQEFTRLAQNDAPFARRLLSYVSNSVVGPGEHVGDVDRAARLLGLGWLRSLAFSLLITHFAPKTDGTEPLLANCLRRAIAARLLARKIQALEPSTCFTLGLFLDCGLLISASDDAKLATSICNSPAKFRLIREKAVGFRVHPDIGASVAKDHGFDKEFIDGILLHHSITCPMTPLARIAWVAERIAAVFEGGYYAAARSSAEEALAFVGRDANELDEFLELIPQGVVELASVFERYVGPQLELEALRENAEANSIAITAQYEELVASCERLVHTNHRLELELHDATERLEKLETTDSLTGVANRHGLQVALERDLVRADRAASDLSILLIDIDHFSWVNEAFGRSTGDSVLALLGRVLRGTLRNGDVAGRYGGEEFLAILPNTEPTGALVVAERIRTAFAQDPISGPRGPVAVTCSVGVSHECGPGCRTAFYRVLRRAAQALHTAKRDGRDRVVFASTSGLFATYGSTVRCAETR